MGLIKLFSEYEGILLVCLTCEIRVNPPQKQEKKISNNKNHAVFVCVGLNR